MKRIALLLVVALMLPILPGMALAEESLGVVETAFGQVSGVELDGGLTMFKGVPFAKPPVGELRWKAPEDPEPWEGVLVCDEYAPMAMQILATDDWYGPEFYYEWLEEDPPMSEDCLYLNITTPATSADDNYPVLVWIHGGAAMHGYSYEPEFNPEELAKKGVVVVQIAYRLGVFGWMATSELSEESETGTSGNYGLLDQIQALNWVQQNISAFGGDPSRVTVAGQSAGARSTSSLIASPLTDGLFSGAIINSGFSALNTLATLEQTEESSEAYLEEKGYGEMTLDELRALPTSAFMNETTEKSEVYNKGFNIINDGYVLTDDYVNTYLQEGSLKGINLIVGSNSGEGNADFSITPQEDFMENSRNTYGELFDKYDFETMYGTMDDIASTMEGLRLRSELGTHQYLLTAQALRELNPDSNIYVYYFSHWTPNRESEIRWAWHSAELWYVFNSMRDIPEQRDWEPLDYQIAEALSSYWANFIKTGDPNSGELPYWPYVTHENPVFMEWGDEFTVRTGFYTDTKREARDEFMKEYTISRYGLDQYLQ